jgi:hypothetical protein
VIEVIDDCGVPGTEPARLHRRQISATCLRALRFCHTRRRSDPNPSSNYLLRRK